MKAKINNKIQGIILRKSLPRLWCTRVKNNEAVKSKSLKMQLFFYTFGTYVVLVL
jgi:hypothetical protein